MLEIQSSPSILPRKSVVTRRGFIATVASCGVLAACHDESHDPRRTAAQRRDWEAVAYPSWEPDAYRSDAARVAISQIADLGVKAIQLVPTWYSPARDSVQFGPDPEQSPTDQALEQAIEWSHSAGLAVMLKPHVDVLGDSDRAQIQAAAGPWFETYHRFTDHYTALAAKHQVRGYCVGTELNGMAHFDADWKAVIASVRSAFSGDVTYAANFDSYSRVNFWQELDVIGINGYFNLVDRATADVDRLVRAWDLPMKSLSEFSAAHNRPIVMTEIGFRSIRGAAVAPWEWAEPGEASNEEQAAAYQAALVRFAEARWLRGVQWWMWDDPTNESVPHDRSYSPRGKPAEEVLRSTYGGD